jgi:transposase
MREDAPQREHSLRDIFNALRWMMRSGSPWRYLPREADPSAVVIDSRTLQGTPASGHRGGYDGAKRRKGWKVRAAVDTLGHLLALRVTAANEQDRERVRRLAKGVQEARGDSVMLAYVDQGYAGEETAMDAAERGVQLHVVSLPQARRGFVLLPRRWVVERSFAWDARFRRLAKDYERSPQIVAGVHHMVFACLMRRHVAEAMAQGA